MDITQKNKRDAQDKVKERYEKFAREICYKPGDLVLVL